MPKTVDSTRVPFVEDELVERYPALIRRGEEAIEKGVSLIYVWGDRTAAREFLHVDDCSASLPVAIASIGLGAREDH